MDGFGNINWWGFSPSINLLESFDLIKTDKTELNVLLVNSGDQRHILHTIALLKKNDTKIKKVNFYVYEKMLELYARDFLLISLAIEHPSRRGIQEKSELFLEIFGNLFTREFTSAYIQTKANEFIKYITDLDYLQRTNLQLFDFSLLKYKERDFLEGIFKFWRLKLEPEKFPVDKCWEFRLRAYFGTRYDTRSNAFDWDFSMKILERKNAGIINNRVYSRWRENGIAFDLRDSTYVSANKTLASGMILEDPRHNGDKTSRRGFFGDIIVGPYLAYGIESKNKELFKKQNDLFAHTATDVARDNLSSYFTAILEQNGFDLKKYQLDLNKKMTGLTIQEVIEEEEEQEQEEQKKLKVEDEYIRVDNFSIHFLPLTVNQDFSEKEKYNSFFDVVYFSNSGSVHLNKSMKKILRPDALVFMETAKFMIEMTNEQIKAFSDRLKQIASDLNLKDLNNYDVENDKNESATTENSNKKSKTESLNYLLFKN